MTVPDLGEALLRHHSDVESQSDPPARSLSVLIVLGVLGVQNFLRAALPIDRPIELNPDGARHQSHMDKAAFISSNQSAFIPKWQS